MVRLPAVLAAAALLFGIGGCIVPPPSSSSTDDGTFRVTCEFSHRAQVDPIVNPGGVGAHMHDFFGNNSTNANSTYRTMVAASTNCTHSGDKAGYWAPTLYKNGQPVPVDRAIFYYRNHPVQYSKTLPFPPNFKMIAGGAGTFPNTYWTCSGESDTGFQFRRDFVPNCSGGAHMRLHIIFPSCWDGVRLDSADHRSHVAYGRDRDGRVEGSDPEDCPPSHPVKVPQLEFRVQYERSNGAGARFSDGTVLAHADFWNTWVQTDLAGFVNHCLGYAGISCGLIE